jgi:glycosyltransferase involved in cell wall biosynthesis
MPEVLGDAGCYFDPERPDEIAAALRHLIESRELRTMMAARAHQRAQDFSWKRCARETFAFLATICESFEHASVAAASGR